jgi:predicted HTH domain antitoxin
MNLTLPDDPTLDSFGEAELRLELAVALFASGRISRNVAARIAEMDRFIFDEELLRRKTPSYTRDMVEEDLDTLQALDLL